LGHYCVAIKNDAQRVVLSLHRLRAQLKVRIMQTNELRGLLYEFGVVLSEGHRALLKELPAALQEAQSRLPAMLIDRLDEQVRRINQLDVDIATIERRLSQQLRQTPACKALAEIAGVGVLTATAIVASMGSPTAFKDAREFAAWIGLVPKQTGTGGRVRKLGISKRGDAHFANLAHARSASSGQVGPGCQLAMVERTAEAPPVKHCGRRRCQQAGQDDLGGVGQGSGMAATGLAGGLTMK
jgi:transposase